jgi:hypothetical protein
METIFDLPFIRIISSLFFSLFFFFLTVLNLNDLTVVLQSRTHTRTGKEI